MAARRSSSFPRTRSAIPTPKRTSASAILPPATARAVTARGHRVALQLENRPEFPLHFLALNSLGVSVVPLNPDYRAAELDYVLAHSEASALIDAQTLEDLPQPGKTGNAGECALLYTSGTTGKPKGCLLSDFYFLNVGQRYLDEGGLCACATAKSGSSRRCRFFHMNALAVSTTAMILSAGCVVQLDRFHPRTWWRDVVDSRRHHRSLPWGNAGDPDEPP